MGKPVSDKVKNLMERFSNATLRAAIAEYAPAAAASGYSIDSKTGKVTQDIDDPGAVRLRKDLPVIGMAGLGVMGAGLLSGVSAAQVGSALEKGLSYMQPSKYMDAVAHIGKPVSNLIGGMSYGNGATTLAGALADSAFDSYLAAHAASNLGRSNNVTDVVKNSLDLLPMMAPASKMSKWFLRGLDNEKEFERLARNPDNLMPGLRYAQDKYITRADKLHENYVDSGGKYTHVNVYDPATNSKVLLKKYDKGHLSDDRLPKLEYLESAIKGGEYDNGVIRFNIDAHKGHAFYGGTNYALGKANATMAHEGTHWALENLGDGLSAPDKHYYVANRNHPLYNKISPFFNKQTFRWHRSPEEMVAELTGYGYLNSAPVNKDFSEWDKRIATNVFNGLLEKGWKPKQEAYDAAKTLSHFGYGDGGSIHIAPSKRGTFTAAAKKHGKSVQAFASQVLAHKENYSPAMVKKANFARNAAKWHADGGFLNEYPKGGDFDTIKTRPDYKANIVQRLVQDIVGPMYYPQPVNVHGDFSRFYFGRPTNKDTFYKSQYKPTKSSESDATYYGVKDPLFLNDLIHLYNRSIHYIDDNGLSVIDIDPLLNAGESRILDGYLARNESRSDTEYVGDSLERHLPGGDNPIKGVSVSNYPLTDSVGALGNFTISRGSDDKGDYLSYYDKWDLNGFTNTTRNVEKYGIGKPYEIYDRIYGSFDEDGTFHPSGEIQASYIKAYPDGGEVFRDGELEDGYGGILNRLRNVYGSNDEIKAAILRAKNIKKN